MDQLWCVGVVDMILELSLSGWKKVVDLVDQVSEIPTKINNSFGGSTLVVHLILHIQWS